MGIDRSGTAIIVSLKPVVQHGKIIETCCATSPLSDDEMGRCLEPWREPEKSMRTFLLWDHDGVLVDTARWFFVATQECLRHLGVTLDHATYLQDMATGRSCWKLVLDQGQSAAIIAAHHAVP